MSGEAAAVAGQYEIPGGEPNLLLTSRLIGQVDSLADREGLSVVGVIKRVGDTCHNVIDGAKMIALAGRIKRVRTH